MLRGQAGHSSSRRMRLGGQAGHSQQQKAVQRRVILASGTPGCSLPVLPHTGARADP